MTYLEFGKSKEIEFAKILLKHVSSSCSIKYASPEEDIKKHIDLWLVNSDYSWSFDVKSIKKENRSFGYNDQITWLELYNVNGDKGWMFGEARFIVFETWNEWIIVNRKDLLKQLYEKLTENIKKFKLSKSKEFFTQYQRDNRKDIIVKVPIDWIKSINPSILKK